MKRCEIKTKISTIFLLLCLVFPWQAVHAHDFGQRGTTFFIAEDDFLEALKKRLHQLPFNPVKKSLNQLLNQQTLKLKSEIMQMKNKIRGDF